MKKFFLFLLGAVILTACSDDDGGPQNPPNDTLAEMIIGEWVYDNPAVGVWEKQILRNNMSLYYSSQVLNPYVSIENAEGTFYFTSENRITLAYQNIMGYTTYADLEIESIEKYSYTATFRDDDGLYGGRYTYNRLIDDVELEFGEKVTPAYSRLVTDAVIRYYYSNDNAVATVNSTTGEITAGEKAGLTYINVVTDEGTAVVEVKVTDPANMIPDYSDALNMSEDEVKATWTDFCTYNPPLTDRVCYPLRGNDYAQMAVIYLNEQRNVELVSIQLRDTLSGSGMETAIHQFLSSKYEFQGPMDGGYLYFDFSQPDVLPLAVVYYPSLGEIEYLKVDTSAEEELWPDYTQAFGMTAYELKAEFGEPFYETDDALYVLQENEYIDFVAFSLNTSTGRTYASSAFLKADCDWQAALDYLNQKFYYFESGSEPENSYYAFTDQTTLEASRTGITFDGVNGLITYVDLTASPNRSVKKNGIFPFPQVRVQRPR